MPQDAHGATLPAPAQAAWRAYRSMQDSKDAHFAYLEMLHHRYEHGGSRSLAEIARLETLLAEHDRCVQTFAQEMRALISSDKAAHAALVDTLTRFNQTLGATPPGSGEH